MNRPKVWVIHEQLKRDPGTGQMRKAFDTRPAEKWGDRVTLFQDAASHMNFQDAMDVCRTKMSDFKPEDYLLFCGAPDLACAAVVAAADAIQDKPLQILVWCKNRQKPDYEVRSITRGVLFNG